MTNKSNEYYDSIASGYNLLYEEEQKYKLEALKILIESLSIDLKEKIILDVGCGTGISSDFFINKFDAHVVGVDPSKKLLRENKTRKAKFMKGCAEELPFEDKSFDVVISISAIQNFENIQKGLEEINRVSKNTVLLSFMSKGNEDSDSITALIKKQFTVLAMSAAKNDTLFVCEKIN